jgi:hypothetical protein
MIHKGRIVASGAKADLLRDRASLEDLFLSFAAPGAAGGPGDTDTDSGLAIVSNANDPVGAGPRTHPNSRKDI